MDVNCFLCKCKKSPRRGSGRGDKGVVGLVGRVDGNQ